MLYVTPSNTAHVIVQFIIVELDGLNFKLSEPFKNKYYDEEVEAYFDIAEKGKTSTRYVVVPTSTIILK